MSSPHHLPHLSDSQPTPHPRRSGFVYACHLVPHSTFGVNRWLKKQLRFVPIFPELLAHLEASFDVAPEGQARCLQRFTRAANLGTHMNRIVERCGIKPWPKTFQNLRASRRTELEERFPNHVVNAWLGHSAKVAEKSYLQVTPDHWAAGASIATGNDTATNGGVVGGVISANHQCSGAIEQQKTPVDEATDSCKTLGIVGLAPPTGLEPVTRWLTATCSTN